MDLLNENDEEKFYTLSDYHTARVFYEDEQFFLHLTKKMDNDEIFGLILDRTAFDELKKIVNTLATLSDDVNKRGQRVNQSFDLSDDVRVSINWKFSGAVDFRKFWIGKDGVKKPTKQGVCYSNSVFKKLVEVLAGIQ